MHKNTPMDLYVCFQETNEKAERNPLWADGAEATRNWGTVKDVTRTPNNSLRDWTKLSHFNGVWQDIHLTDLYGSWVLVSPKETWASPAEHSPHQHIFYSYHNFPAKLWLRAKHLDPPAHLWICWRSCISILSIPAHMNFDVEAERRSKISTLSQNLLVSTAPKDNLGNPTCSLTDRNDLHSSLRGKRMSHSITRI